MKSKISQEEIKQFIEGRDPMEHIVNISYHYRDDFVTIYYRDDEDRKCAVKDPFYPFLWATRDACLRLCGGDRTQVKKLLNEYSIGVKVLSNVSSEGEVVHEFDNGYMFMFYAKKAMSYNRFITFFKKAKNPVYAEKDSDGNEIKRPEELERQYLVATPQEQHMIRTGKRFFKGYDDYDQILRMIFDLETEGLDPEKDRIKLNGIRFNRGTNINGKKYKRFEKIFRIEGETEEEKDASELKLIDTMLRIIYTYRPDVITAHNGENFDWNFIDVRCRVLGTSLSEMSAKYFDGESIRKEEKETILKLGGEIETFNRTIVPNIIVTDSLHAVRRAQATDSNFLKADLKYSTAYLRLKKDNRVYTPGKEIDAILMDTEHKYAYNDTDGDWYLYDETLPDSTAPFKKGKDGDKPFIMYKRNKLYEGYEVVSGEYIINRYLLDDLWECDKVEYSLNGTEFVLCKLLPVTFSKCCTMGTAGQWKAIMMAWSYERGLAIPKAENTGAFTGGLSRLMRTGYVKNVIKLDYNSLYPSIILTWGISDITDLMKAMLYMLEYVLTTRETYKGLKKAANKAVDKYKKLISEHVELTHEQEVDYETEQMHYKVYDGRQLSVKKLGNSFFGSYGSNSGPVFPWKSVKCAEQTTCTGRQSLRLMVSHFKKLGYTPIVGDSFTPDTPLFIKYNDSGLIDIKPVKQLIGETEVDMLGREYDISKKPFKVLCRSGWVEPQYIYRHKTNKPLYEISEGDMRVTVTEDHSLFSNKREKIKPSEIKEGTKLEYYKGEIKGDKTVSVTDEKAKEWADKLLSGKIDRIPIDILNSDKATSEVFLRHIEGINYQKLSKTCVAGILYLKRRQSSY